MDVQYINPTIALPFETEAGPVTVEVCFNH